MGLFFKGLIFYKIDFWLNEWISQYKVVGNNTNNSKENLESNLNRRFAWN